MKEELLFLILGLILNTLLYIFDSVAKSSLQNATYFGLFYKWIQPTLQRISFWRWTIRTTYEMYTMTSKYGI